MSWRIEILKGAFVRWGYGPEAQNGMRHLEPAVRVLDIIGIVMNIPFELPEAREGSSLGAPTEYERVDGFGWRLSSGIGTATDWRFSATLEQAQADSKAYAIDFIARHPHSTQLRSVLDDVRILEG